MCISPLHNENMSIELKIESRIEQRMGYWAHDRCTVSKSDHDQQTYPKALSKW